MEPFFRVLPPAAVRRRFAGVRDVPAGARGLLGESLTAPGAQSFVAQASHLQLPALPVPPEGALAAGSVEALRDLARGLPPEAASAAGMALARAARRDFALRLPTGRTLALGPRTLVMGILNVTPDSFSDGGRHQDPDRAAERGLAMAAEGADILDVGGESTRPGSAGIDPEEEIRRIVPVVARLAARTEVPISVDTRHGATARAALGAGASILNDVSALADPAAAEAARDAGAPVVLMHMRGTPADMRERAVYRDVVGEVVRELAERVRAAEAAGLPREGLIVDPGIGFAKTAEQSWTVLRDLGELRVLGLPILAGPSRKSFLATVRPVGPGDRLALTLGAVLAAAENGAHVVRVHDVRETVDALRAYESATD